MKPVRRLRSEAFKRTVAQLVLRLNEELEPGDESQLVEIHGPAWAEVVDAARGEFELPARGIAPRVAADEFEAQICQLVGLEPKRWSFGIVVKEVKDRLEAAAAAVQRAEALEEFKTDLKHALGLPTPSTPLEILNAVKGAAYRAQLEAARDEAARRAEVFEPVPPPKGPRKRAAKTKAAPCCGSVNTTFTEAGDCQACGAYVAAEDRLRDGIKRKRIKVGPCPHCGDHDHGAAQCGTAPADDPPVPQQSDIEQAIRGES
jgi:hypothetical protein